MLFVTFMIMQACFQVAGFARAFPLFFLMALIPALFWTFRNSLRGGSGLIVVLLLIRLMPLPMVSNSLVSGATPLLFGPSGALLPLPDDFQEFFRPVHS